MEQSRASALDDNGTLELTNTSASMTRGCPTHYQVYHTVWAATEIFTVIVSFPAGMVVVYGVVQRFLQSGQRGRGMSCWSFLATSSDLLLISLISVNFVYLPTMLLHASNTLRGNLQAYSRIMIALNHLIYTAAPLGMMCVCLDCYLAVVHPISYPHLKKTWRHPLLLTALTWTYVLTTEIIVIALKMPEYNTIWTMTFAMTCPTALFLTISMLFTLRLTGPKRRSLADLCPVKRQAFFMVLGITVNVTLYCLPMVTLYICYQAMHDMNFRCVVFPVVMVVPTLVAANTTLLFAFKAGVKFCTFAE